MAKRKSAHIPVEGGFFLVVHMPWTEEIIKNNIENIQCTVFILLRKFYKKYRIKILSISIEKSMEKRKYRVRIVGQIQRCVEEGLDFIDCHGDELSGFIAGIFREYQQQFLRFGVNGIFQGG